jgi:hypothetical protein
VYGKGDYALYGAGDTCGVYGNGDYGVFGYGSNYGLYGYSASRGVYGEAPTGVYGKASTNTSTGVYGYADFATGTNYGVRGQTRSAAGYGVFSQGDFGGTGSKYFVQPHPTDASKEIRFVCLEGNESGTYFRGSARIEGGQAVIEVPEEFSLVTEAEGLTVQVTPMGPVQLWIEEKSLDRIVVCGDADVEFDYFVNGVRRGFSGHECIRPNQAWVPEVRGVPFGTQYPRALQRILIQNGILNPDLTPNEVTAARNGWALRDPETREQPPVAESQGK